MNKLTSFYAFFLAAFAVFLAYLGETWYSVFVLGLSFLSYAILIGINQKNT